MIQQIAKDNEAVTPITREMEGLKEYFPQCFNKKGEFDIEKFREAIQPQVDVTREGRSYDFLGKSYARMLSSLDTTTKVRKEVREESKGGKEGREEERGKRGNRREKRKKEVGRQRLERKK